jgi:hypothetical protein
VDHRRTGIYNSWPLQLAWSPPPPWPYKTRQTIDGPPETRTVQYYCGIHIEHNKAGNTEAALPALWRPGCAEWQSTGGYGVAPAPRGPRRKKASFRDHKAVSGNALNQQRTVWRDDGIPAERAPDSVPGKLLFQLFVVSLDDLSVFGRCYQGR